MTIDTSPTLFLDPTSEPSRAVHWFCEEASIPIRIERIYLTRDEHLAADFVAVNPRHQVPALLHRDRALSEATAIMRYLAELNACEARWLGNNITGRARINQLLSWYHTNLRLKVTLNYFLPVLLAPAYVGAGRPDAARVDRKREAFRETLLQLDTFLGGTGFLAGSEPTIPDLLFASELVALDADPDRDNYLQGHGNVCDWLGRMRELPGYATVHACWSAVAEHMLDMPGGEAAAPRDPTWVAELCERVDQEGKT